MKKGPHQRAFFVTISHFLISSIFLPYSRGIPILRNDGRPTRMPNIEGKGETRWKRD